MNTLVLLAALMAVEPTEDVRCESVDSVIVVVSTHSVNIYFFRGEKRIGTRILQSMTNVVWGVNEDKLYVEWWEYWENGIHRIIDFKDLTVIQMNENPQASEGGLQWWNQNRNMNDFK